MRTGFHRTDYAKLEGLWRAFFPERWQVDAQTIRRHTANCPLFDWGASSTMICDGLTLGMLSIKRSASPRFFAGADPDTAHLNAIAFTEPSVAIDLFADAKKVLRNRGIHRIAFGQDCNHFFSGCPSDCGALRSFLMVEGFEEDGENVDLERDLSNYEPPKGCLDILGSHPGSTADKKELPAVRALKEGEKERLRDFLHREFPGRWTHDTMTKIDTEGKTDFVYVLEAGGQFEGFALTQDATHLNPINGAVWHEALGENWGALGPIGVSESVRGRGLGKALLAASLVGLQGRGVRNTIIDWTGLVDFYGAHGFEVSRRNSTLSLNLG